MSTDFRVSGGAPPPEALLDLRADSAAESLHLLALVAASTLCGLVGGPIDCALTHPRAGRVPLAVGTSASALKLAHAEQDDGNNPISEALSGRVAMVANNYSPHPGWPSYWQVLEEAGYRSTLSVPVPLTAGCFAALTFLSGQDNVFTASVAASAVAFGKRAGSSFALAEELRTARSSADQLRAALNSRTDIDAACGVIMAQNKCSYDKAFQILATASSHRNTKVRVLAKSILDTVASESSGA